jgi:hypothetical protein
MIGLVMSPVIPQRGGGISQAAKTPTGTNTAVNQPTVTPTRTPDEPAPPTQSTIVLRLMGTWLAEDPSAGLDRVTFSKYPPGTPDPNPNGGKVEAAFAGDRVLGDFVITGAQIVLQFPNENPAVHAFEFLNDGRLRIGQAIYRKG